VQKKYFDWQLSLAVKHRLPLFLHSRAAASDFISILQARMAELSSALSEGASAPPALPTHLADSGGNAQVSEALRVGVVHSFTGSLEEMQELVSLGLFIGVNGCSLKTEENLAVVKAIPLSRLMLETDAPWCDLRPTHASAKYVKAALDGPAGERLKALYSPATVKKEKHDPEKMVKGRNEPCAIGQVAAVVAGVKGLDVAEVAAVAERNTRWLFGL
jgi:TatD DNase family protein